MKTCKSLVALFLTVCLLIGMPLSVSAVGTTTPTDLRLIGAQPILLNGLALGSSVHTASAWKDQGVVFYFNQDVTNFVDGTGVKARMVVVNENDEIVSYDGKKMVWNISGHGGKNDGVPIAIYGIVAYCGQMDPRNSLPINNWTELIAALTTDATLKATNCRLQLRLYDNTVNNNGVLDSLTAAADTSIKMAATGYDGSDKGTGRTGDYAAFDLGVAAAGATDITWTGMVTLDRVQMINQTAMTLTYSEAVSARMSDGVSVRVQVVEADGTEVHLFNATGVSATRVELNENKTWADVQALIDAGEGRYARLRVQEKAPAAARDERANNYAVDTIWGTESQKPLQGDWYHAPGTTDAASRDYAYCRIEAPIENPRVISAELQQMNQDSKFNVLVTFSKPVTFNDTYKSKVMVRFTGPEVHSTTYPQRILQSFTYVNPSEPGYSNQIMFTFNYDANYPLKADGGIGFYEYDMTSEFNDGQVAPSIIADKYGKGLESTYKTSQGVEISYTKLTLAESEQKILSVTHVDNQTVTVKFGMHVKAIDVANITYGGVKAVAAEGSGDTWTLTMESAVANGDAVLNIPANSLTISYNDTVVTKAFTEAVNPGTNFQEKFDWAVANGYTELAMTENATVDILMVPYGFTLDLNGYVLTTDAVNSFGNVKDSSEGEGGIAIAKNDTDDNSPVLFLQSDNVMMPLYEKDFGYRFFTVTMTQLYKTDVCKFGFQLNINAKGLALLKDAANADVRVETRLVVTVDDEVILEKLYAFNASTIADYATKKAGDPDSNWAIILTINGFDKLSGNSISVTSTPAFNSLTGVSVAPTADATVTYTLNR